MGLKVKTFWNYNGLFEKCHLEPLKHGYSVFDSTNDFVGAVTDNGFALNSSYAFADEVFRELANRKITVFDYDTSEEIQHQHEMDEVGL